MSERPRWPLQTPGFLLLFASVFLAISLAGYDPADPPGRSVEPPNAVVANPCGPVGAWLAQLVFQTIGWGLFVPLVALSGILIRIFRGGRLNDLPRGLAGLALLTILSSTAFHAIAPGLSPSEPIGSGGDVGALVATILGEQFGRVGMALGLVAIGLVGARLAIEPFLLAPIREIVLAWKGFGRRTSPSERGIPAPHTETIPERAVRGMLPAVTIPSPAIRAALPSQTVARREEPKALAPIARSATGAYSLPVPADGSFQLPPLELLEPPAFLVQEHDTKVNERAVLLEKTLLEHGCHVRVVQIDTGPVITQFEIELEPGLRVSKIVGLANDLAIALAVPSVRIVAPIPGKTTVGIEVPNERRGIVRLGDVLEGVGQRLTGMKIPLFLGKDVKGNPLAFDLADMPHLLIAGRTGTGKSVCLNSMILSILMTRRPDEVKLILIDPKMVELSQFKKIPHLMHPVVTDMKKAESLLAWACDKMDERYGYLARAGVRNLQTYNQLGAEEIYARLQPEDDEERSRIPTYMPYIVIIADEVGDLMMTAAKEVESHIVRLAQKARAVGMHLIIATQKPTVDVITGLIKGNMPARIAFQVTSRGDSRVVLDEMGADKLLGMGDMLFLVPGTSHIVRAQGTYVSDQEVFGVCGYLEQFPPEFSRELMQLKVGGGDGKDRGAALKERDDLYEAAIEVIVREGRGSTSLLQRALGIGYGRAARLIDFMHEDGIVGEFKSGTAREVLYSWEEWEALKGGGSAESESA